MIFKARLTGLELHHAPGLSSGAPEGLAVPRESKRKGLLKPLPFFHRPVLGQYPAQYKTGQTLI